jgi:hypothetical protein
VQTVQSTRDESERLPSAVVRDYYCVVFLVRTGLVSAQPPPHNLHTRSPINSPMARERVHSLPHPFPSYLYLRSIE